MTHRPLARMGWVVLALVAWVAAFSVPARAATPPDVAAQRQLVERYAPYMSLPPPDKCGPSFRPIDVSVLMDNPSVALRGPWGDDLVRAAPGPLSLTRGLKGYWLDFPGNPLQPGCTYSEWQESIARHDQPYVYAHVAPDPHGADRLAVQYWFFYLLNDWKNKHEGDWEMIQLEFDVGTAERALAAEPAHATYSQHSGAERVEWTSDGLQRVGDHPVVYVSQGSHANYLHSGVFLGRGGARASAATTRGATSTPTSKPRASSCSPTLPRRGRSGSPTGGTGASR